MSVVKGQRSKVTDLTLMWCLESGRKLHCRGNNLIFAIHYSNKLIFSNLYVLKKWPLVPHLLWDFSFTNINDRILTDIYNKCIIIFTQLTLFIQVIMRNLTTEEVSVFTYEDWLSRTHGPKRTMICEMGAVVDEEMMVELTTYIIQVKTSDISGNMLLAAGLQTETSQWKHIFTSLPNILWVNKSAVGKKTKDASSTKDTDTIYSSFHPWVSVRYRDVENRSSLSSVSSSSSSWGILNDLNSNMSSVFSFLAAPFHHLLAVCFWITFKGMYLRGSCRCSSLQCELFPHVTTNKVHSVESL